MSDNFESHRKSLVAPADRWRKVMPEDNTDLSPVPRAVMVNGDGYVAMQDAEGNIIAPYLLRGFQYALRPVRILTEDAEVSPAQATTATGIMVLE